MRPNLRIKVNYPIHERQSHDPFKYYQRRSKAAATRYGREHFKIDSWIFPTCTT